MKENRDYLELALESIKLFGNDGTLDTAELEKLFRLARRDGQVDENEVRVLVTILSKLKSHELSTAMREQVRAFENEHGVCLLKS